MKAFARHSAFLVLLSLLLAPLAVGHASPPPNNVPFYQPLDFEQRERDHIRPVGKLAQGASPKYIVRIIHFVPSDRSPQEDVGTQIDALIKRVQQFYADEMERHGLGRKTFRFETDAAGKAVVHHVMGKFDTGHYHTKHGFPDVHREITEQLGRPNNIVYFIWKDYGAHPHISGRSGYGHGDSFGGIVELSTYNIATGPIRYWKVVAHELGHGFGLAHDFRNDRYIMSYGPEEFQNQLSQCAAEWLDGHRYFNTNQTSFGQPPTVQMMPPSLASPPNAIRLRFKVTDSDGLHKAYLFMDSIDYESGHERSFKVLDCKSLNGESGTIAVEFVTTELAARSTDVGLSVIDVHGNFTELGFQSSFKIDITSLRPSSKVMSIPDAELATAIRENLQLASGDAITQLDMLDLTTLNAPSHQIINLTGLEYATNLKYVDLSENQISNLTPFAGLTKVRRLNLARNRISNVAPLAKLVNLSTLALTRNPISDTSPLLQLLRKNPNMIIDLELDIEIPHSLTKVSGDGQQGLAGEQLAAPFVVSVLDQEGSAFAGAVVTFSVTAGGGTLAATTATTDASGRARTTLTLGSELGTNTVAATVAGLGTVTFTATATEQTAHSLTKVSGDNQAGPASTQLAAPLVVSVLDQDGEAFAGASVTFSVTAGGGMLSSTTASNSCAVGSSTSSTTIITDANGQAAIRLTLGSESGPNTAVATVEGLESVTFTATAAEQAMPHRLTKVCGDDQEGTVGASLTAPLVVSVSDEDGAAMAGVIVSFAVTAGGGTLSAATATTDANGRAATSLSLGSEAGTNTISATVEGLASVTFTATGQEDPLVNLFDLFGSGKLAARPDRTQLLQNAPNPFNSETVVSYFLLEPGPVRLEVFALSGQRVAVLHQGMQQAGYHRLHWDGRDAAGRSVASGIYLYRLVTSEDVLTRKLVLLR